MRGYFGSIPAAQGQEFLYILTGGAASVSGADSLGRVLAYANQGLVRVFLNGARLTPGIEYTATNGTTITFVGWTGSANDELLIEVLTGLVVADTLRPAQNLADLASLSAARANLGVGGTFRGDNGLIGTAPGNDIFRIHKQNLATQDVTIGATENAIAVGPLTVDSGRTLTVTSGGTLVIA